MSLSWKSAAIAFYPGVLINLLSLYCNKDLTYYHTLYFTYPDFMGNLAHKKTKNFIVEMHDNQPNIMRLRNCFQWNIMRLRK